MAIKEIYPTNIYHKQLDISEEKLAVIESFLRAQHLNFISSTDNDHAEYQDGNENIVIDAIVEGQCPEMKELIDERVIGKIYNSFVSVGQYLPDWRKTKEYKNSVSAKKSLGGGVLFELSHEIDYIQWMLGSLKVHYAQLRSTSELNLEVEELADIILVSDSGSVCNIHLDFLQKKANRTCSFIGEKGRLDWDLINNKIKLHRKDSSEILLNKKDWDPNQMYISLLKDFLELVAGNKNSTINLKEATKTIELIEKIKISAVQGVKQ